MLDVRISCASADRQAARGLAARLSEDGISTFISDGAVAISAGGFGIKTRILLLLLSAKAISSELGRLEREAILFRDPNDPEQKFLPVCLDETELPESFRQFATLKWILRSDQEYSCLSDACRRPIFFGTKDEDSVRIDQRGGKIIQAHKGGVASVNMTPDGQFAVSGSDDKTVRFWDLKNGNCLECFTGHIAGVTSVAISSNAQLAISGGKDNQVILWDLVDKKPKCFFREHRETVWSVAISSRGEHAVSGSYDSSIRVWDLQSGSSVVIAAGICAVRNVAITPDGRTVISSGDDQKLRAWNARTGESIGTIDSDTHWRLPLTISKDGNTVVTGNSNGQIGIWNFKTGEHTNIAGHMADIRAISVTSDGIWAISGGDDRTVRLWNLRTKKCAAILEGHIQAVTGVSINSTCSRAISCSEDGTIHVWNLAGLERYTNAKVLLVGDSGVGKSGLAIRLAESRFEATISTDAAWATQMRLPPLFGKQSHEREIWLWDFAGQSDYRLIHQLYMDETSLAVLIFNPQHDNPFEGLSQWNKDLERAARRSFNKLLVAGRCDRGGPTISKEAIERFRVENRFSGYLETSALTGKGCEELHNSIVDGIPWDDIPWTTSPNTFKALKQEILRLKDEGRVLLRTSELYQHLQLRLLNKQFTPEELRAVIGLLAGPGVVWQLEFGDFILLQPEKINAYAAAVVRSVRAHIDEIGCISEQNILSGKLDYQDMERLKREEEQIVLRAMHQIFVDHGLCLREYTGQGDMLVFPSYFRRERPDLGEHPAAFVTYEFTGSLNETYATLIVKLHHTTQFEKVALWRYAADFQTPEGKRVGLKMLQKAESKAEITVYFDPSIPDDTKVTFIRYVHDHLKGKDSEVIRVRHYVCPNCDTPVENRKVVEQRIRKGYKDVVCVSCESRIPLIDLIETKFASDEFKRRVRELEEQAKINIDNESRELILVGHAFAIAGEAGQIYRGIANSDWGIDGEIEFKDYSGRASGKRVYLQLKSGNSYLTRRKSDDAEVFTVKNHRHLEYWTNQAYPVMLVIKTGDGKIRWMDVSAYLIQRSAKTRPSVTEEPETNPNQIIFTGEPFNAQSLLRFRDRFVPFPKETSSPVPPRPSKK